MARDVPAPIETGRSLGGRYRLVRHIARGGMAEVWEGHDEVLSRPVAIKVLRAHLAEDGVFLERFRREAVTAARLAHPAVVSTFDTGIDSGTAYIVMELVRGCTLRELLSERAPLEPWLAVAITRQIADALAYAHQAGLVHRDVKPANVLLTDDEWGGMRVKVTDFGIAKAGTALGGDLTRTGIVLGTPKYLSPEQIRGKEPDARADLYSLGVVLFEMLTGNPPFVGATDMATALAHLNDRVPRISRTRSVPPALDRLTTDLLAKDPQLRVPSAAVLRQRLDACTVVPPLQEARDGRRPGRRHRYGTLTEMPHRPARNGGPVAAAGTATTRSPIWKATVPLVEGAARPGWETGSVSPRMVEPSSPAPTHSLRADTTSSRQPDRPTERVTPPATPEPTPRPARRRRRTPGLVVLGLAVTGAIVAGVLFYDRQHHSSNASSGTGSSGAVASSRDANVAQVELFMLHGTPDDPQGLPYTVDGNTDTYWHTDYYENATFGNLYPGLGLEIQLKRSGTLHHLVVTSSTVGWSAQTYTSAAQVSSGHPVTAWGTPTASKTAISGSTTFSLAGRRGQWVLLWLTNLGQPIQSGFGLKYQARISELSVS